MKTGTVGLIPTSRNARSDGSTFIPPMTNKERHRPSYCQRKKGRDAGRPPQTHPEIRSAAITRAERRPRRIPPRRYRPKPPQDRHADPNANADLSNLRRRAAHEHGRDRRSPPPQYFKTDFFNGIGHHQSFSSIATNFCKGAISLKK